MKIATWNVNSINARLEHLLNWLKEEEPDVVLLQETKSVDEAFPFEQIEDLGYSILVNGQKSYNGVAILSKFNLSDVIKNFPDNPLPNEARYIEAIFNFSNQVYRVASVYVPNGQEVGSEKYYNKLKFLSALTSYFKSNKEEDEFLIIGGDFNIALNDMDVYDYELLQESICFSLKERQELRKFLAIGFVDVFRTINSSDQEFSWWDYRNGSFRKNLGMRIDYLFCSHQAMQVVKDCKIDKIWRSKERASDHVPVFLEI